MGYVVGVQSTLSVWMPGQVPLPKCKWNGKGRPTKLLRRDPRHRPVCARELAINLPSSAWKKVIWTEGTRKALLSRFAALRVRPAHRDYWMSEPWDVEWLLIEWPSPELAPTRYWLSTTLPVETKLQDLVRLAKHRWIIECDYEELKQELGLVTMKDEVGEGFTIMQLCVLPPMGSRCRMEPFFPLGSRWPLTLIRTPNAAALPAPRLAPYAPSGITHDPLLPSARSSPEFCSGNSPVVLFVELHFCNTVVLEVDLQLKL